MSAAKVCTICRIDCSNQARVKDSPGRYICQVCVESAKARSSSTSDAPKDTPSHVDEGLTTLALDLENPKPKTKPCRGCGCTLTATALVCSSCGYDFTTGKAASLAKQGGPTCIKCGYNLVGVRSLRCPECGAFNTDASRKSELNRRDRSSNIRAEYTKPLYMLVGGLVVATAASSLSGQSPVESILNLSLGFAISAAIGTIVFFFACLAWIGFDAPFHLTALRMLGIAAVCEAVWRITVQIPIPFLASASLLITYIGLLQSMLDLDLQDAVIFALLNWIVKIFVVAAIVAAMSSL